MEFKRSNKKKLFLSRKHKTKHATNNKINHGVVTCKTNLQNFYQCFKIDNMQEDEGRQHESDSTCCIDKGEI